jgi:hypothetical protein
LTLVRPHTHNRWCAAWHFAAGSFRHALELPAPPNWSASLLAALVAVFAFLLYRSTLLAGVDFGDTDPFRQPSAT